MHNVLWFEYIIATALPALFFWACFSLEYFLFRALYDICHYTSILFIFSPVLQSAMCKGKKFVSVSKGPPCKKKPPKYNNVRQQQKIVGSSISDFVFCNIKSSQNQDNSGLKN